MKNMGKYIVRTALFIAIALIIILVAVPMIMQTAKATYCYDQTQFEDDSEYAELFLDKHADFSQCDITFKSFSDKMSFASLSLYPTFISDEDYNLWKDGKANAVTI